MQGRLGMYNLYISKSSDGFSVRNVQSSKKGGFAKSTNLKRRKVSKSSASRKKNKRKSSSVILKKNEIETLKSRSISPAKSVPAKGNSTTTIFDNNRKVDQEKHTGSSEKSISTRVIQKL